MRGHKKPGPIPIAYKILPHPNIFKKTLAQLNTMVRYGDVPSELDHTLEEWPAWGITLQAKFKEPIRDCTSLSVQDLLPLNSVKQVRRWTLSGGRRASMRSESRTVPMNSRVVEGPCVLWGAMGIPRFLKVSNMLDELCSQAKLWGAIGDGGSITRKSS